MIDLTPHERKRLADLLGKLGSDQPGERDAAATMVEKFRHEHDFVWTDLTVPTVPVRSSPWLPFRFHGIDVSFHSRADAQRFANLISAMTVRTVVSRRKPLAYAVAGFMIGAMTVYWLGAGGTLGVLIGVGVWLMLTGQTLTKERE